MDYRGARVYVAGHAGLVGSAIVRRLSTAGYRHVITRSKQQLDLTRQQQVEAFFREQRPDVVVIAAAKVGGIQANSNFPADFLRDNVLIQTHVIDAAYRHGASRLVFLGSSCIYPRDAPQPMTEDALLRGPLEPTNQWYAIAKIAGIKLCQAYRRQHGFNAMSLIPTNIYGPGDNFDPETSHVVPALLHRFHEAMVQGAEAVTVWGSGLARRELMHADDLADACVFLLEHPPQEDAINVGVGTDVTIAELAQAIRAVVGFAGRIVFDRSRPDGAPRKLLDVSRLRHLGWQPRTDLEQGLRSTYQWFVAHGASLWAGKEST